MYKKLLTQSVSIVQHQDNVPPFPKIVTILAGVGADYSYIFSIFYARRFFYLQSSLTKRLYFANHFAFELNLPVFPYRFSVFF